jgi:hypothetical protein
MAWSSAHAACSSRSEASIQPKGSSTLANASLARAALGGRHGLYSCSASQQMGVACVHEECSDGSLLQLKLPHALDTYSGMFSDPGDQGPVWQGDAPVNESNRHHRESN